jgi:hypothetical protein
MELVAVCLRWGVFTMGQALACRYYDQRECCVSRVRLTKVNRARITHVAHPSTPSASGMVSETNGTLMVEARLEAAAGSRAPARSKPSGMSD